jgi:flagellar motor switch protein FliN/FliY
MENTEWLISEWNAGFADVMQAMADVKPQMGFTAIGSVPQTECLWWQQPFSVAAESPLWVGAPESSWLAIGQLVLLSAGVEGAPVAEARSTYSEIVGQVAGALGREIGARLSNEVTADGGSEAPLDPSVTGRVFEVTAKFPDGREDTFFLIVGEALATALSVSPQATASAGVPTAEHIDQPPFVSNDIANVAKSRTFELLLDVELPISVSFGRTSLRVQDAINLVSGSLIELDRNVSDPVELIVNNSVIARGEVVVIEGNYGIRLTEIVSLKERLQQSRRYMLS